jgi:hypothetical protein
MMRVQSLRVWVCFAPLGANFFLLERSGDRKYSEYTYMLFIRAVLRFLFFFAFSWGVGWDFRLCGWRRLRLLGG